MLKGMLDTRFSPGEEIFRKFLAVALLAMFLQAVFAPLLPTDKSRCNHILIAGTYLSFPTGGDNGADEISVNQDHHEGTGHDPAKCPVCRHLIAHANLLRPSPVHFDLFSAVESRKFPFKTLSFHSSLIARLYQPRAPPLLCFEKNNQ